MKRFKFLWVYISCLMVVASYTVSAQDNLRSLTAKYITSEIILDGVMDEEVWIDTDQADNFWQYFPTDSVRRKNPTKIKILYNETTLYVGVYAEAIGSDFVVSSLKRDFRGTTNDNVSLMFDTFSDGTNAFLFGVSPYGVQREALISNGGSRNGFNPTWDVKWKAESTMHEDHYIVEMAIPFTSLKFKEGDTKWRLQCYRWDFQSNEQSAWGRVPQNQMLSSLAFSGELNFEKPLGKSRTPIALIPYINGLTQKDFENDQGNSEFKFGGDAKVAVGDGLNLDLTINPDFSNVEIDDIFTNLTRFELRLPEKRQFFIDNSDLFASFGNYFNEAKPFWSRRIGLARDTSDNLIQNPIIAGARLSGKLNPNLRLGFLNIQSQEDLVNEIPSNNNMMLALQQKVFARSNIGVFMINRQNFRDYEFVEESDRYNRVIGTDFNLFSKNNVWNGKFYAHKSFQPGDSKGNLSTQAALLYNTRKYSFITDWVYVDEEFRSDLGFVPRTDIFKSGNGVKRNFYPSQSKVNRHGVRLLSVIYWRPNIDFKKSDHRYGVMWDAEFKNQSSMEFNFMNNYIFLTEDFDPSGGEGDPLPGNVGYNFNQVSVSYESNQAQMLNFNLETTIGQFYNGNSYSYAGGVTVRVPPWASFGLSVRYDRIRLPGSYSDADLWLATPKIDITFSKSLFWSTLVQYSNQRENLGINSRIQWRYAPLSDLYLVYNDNYYSSDLSPKFRSINIKLTYWFNPKRKSG